MSDTDIEQKVDVKKPRFLRKIFDAFITLSILAIIIYLIVDGVKKEDQQVSPETSWETKGNFKLTKS